MKKKICTALILSTFLGSLLLIGGCGKKTVIPPDAKSESGGTSMNGGNDINYPSAQGGYSEDNLPSEGTLDDSSGGTALDPSMQSDEFKMAHGRCSPNLSPIYFDFDQASVRGDMSDILVQNSDYLNTIPGARIVIEGNSDERGTNEYNLALGALLFSVLGGLWRNASLIPLSLARGPESHIFEGFPGKTQDG